MECRKELMPATYALRGCDGLDRNDTSNFFNCRDAQVDFFEGIFLHSPHSTCSRGVANQICPEAATNDGANRIIHHQQFVDADTPLIPRLVAQYTTLRSGDFFWNLGPAGQLQAFGIS